MATIAAGTGLRAQSASSDQSLRTWLQTRFAQDRRDAPDAHYVVAWADLDGDRRPEAIVYLLSSTSCGSGGCTLLILTHGARGWRQIGDLTVVNPPVRLLASSSHGWRDLSVLVAGGGARAHDALIAFNGRAYPGNPSMPPARALRRAVAGRVLISDGDRGQPLF